MKKIFPLALVLVISGLMFTGCKKKEDKGNPPVLPPSESMVIDFSNFTSTTKSLEVSAGQKGTENSNWEFAATVAGSWKLILNTTLAVPVAAFKIAVNQTPVFIASKTWQWSYDVTIANVTYNARLTGLIRTSDVQWKMYISQTGTAGFEEFLWFEGTSLTDGSGGQWIMYQDHANPVSFLQIDWTKSSLGVGNIKYTYTKSDTNNGAYIQYGLTTNAYNAFYTVHYYNGTKFSDVNIEWNTTSHEGRIKSSDYLLGAWYCWDSNKINSVCQ